jgi:hypothetical protein
MPENNVEPNNLDIEMIEKWRKLQPNSTNRVDTPVPEPAVQGDQDERESK